MPWNAWIGIEPDDSERATARELYRDARDLDGTVSDLVRVTSRTPQVARLVHELSRAVWVSAKGLTLREKEIAALVTSSLIGCVH